MKNVRLNNMLQYLLVLTSALLLVSCSTEKRETLTSGNLTMTTSDDLFPVIDLQVEQFLRIYEKTDIVHRSATTREAIVQLLNDSVKLIVSARPLNSEERNVALKNNMEIDSIVIAFDGIAVIVNKKNALTKLTTVELMNIVSGKTERWSSMKESKLSSAVVLAMGDPNSGVHEYVASHIAGNLPLSPNVVPCSSTREVFALVQDRPNAVGFVSSAWLPSMPDQCRALEIGDPAYRRDSTSTTMEYFQPHQAYVYQKTYPFIRTVYIYSHNVAKGVGLGFTSFAASSDGQKIIVNNGLVPATMPVRLVQLNTP